MAEEIKSYGKAARVDYSCKGIVDHLLKGYIFHCRDRIIVASYHSNRPGHDVYFKVLGINLA